MSFTVRKLSDKKRNTRALAARALAVVAIAKPLLSLFGRLRKKHRKEKEQKQRISVLKRTLTVLVSVFVALLLLAGIGRAMMSVRDLGISNVLSIAGTDLETDESGFTNIVLMGQGHIDHDGKNLTDTIMLASIDTNTHTVALISIPRDTYFLKTEKMGAGRINTMYRDYRSYLLFQKGLSEDEAEKEALKEVATEIGRKFDVTVHHAVKVDFIAFERAVDVIGGVDIEVPYDIEDLEYPDDNYGFEPFILKAGLRHLDGKTALKYARSRHTSSDFGRSARQQQLLGAMAEKAKEEGILKDATAITSFMKIMSENVLTTMTLRELIGAADLAQKLDRQSLITMQLNDRNALYDYIIEPGGMLYTPPRNLFEGASVLLPVSIPEFPVTWRQPQTLMRLLREHRTIYLENPTISVLNAGAPPGSAGRLGNELIRYGFSVPIVENADIEKIDSSLMIRPIEESNTVAFFSNLTGISLQNAPANLSPQQQSDVTIILGRDYQYKPMQTMIETITPISQLP